MARRQPPWRRTALALLLALTIGLAALQPHPLAAATAAAEPPAPVDPSNAGSFRLGTVRILGVPIITVASPAVGSGGDTGPEAAERARVIEGNLSQLYEPRNPCTAGERLGEALLDHLSVEGTQAACDPNHLGLQGPPEELRVVLLGEPGGVRRLAALLPGRASPFPCSRSPSRTRCSTACRPIGWPNAGAACWSAACAAPVGCSARSRSTNACRPR